MIFSYLLDGTVTCFGEAGSGDELTGTYHKTDLTAIPQEMNTNVECYTAHDGVLLARSQEEIDVILFTKNKNCSMAQIKTDCQDHIYSFYSPPIQQSMALGIYPSGEKDVMVVFIADCIEQENTSHDELVAATTTAQIEQILADIVWPEPEVV